MRIVIAGAGEVGTHLAKMLSFEEQDIIVIDNDEKKLYNLDNYNLMTVRGSAVSLDVLKNVQVGMADIFIAVTPHETINVIACSMAKSMGCKKAVARIDNYEFMKPASKKFFASYGIDTLIYPEYLAAREVMTAMEHTWARSWFEMLNGELIVAGVKIRENARILGHKLKELSGLSSFMHINAIKRNREIIIPGGDDEILANDIIYVATTPRNVDDVVAACGKETHTAERVLIMGGNEIVKQLAMAIKDKYKVKILDSDLERCQKLADELPYCNIVYYEAGNNDVLEEEGVEDYDVFVAMGDSSESNILSCVMAKELGMRKTVAQVENLQFINEAESLNIGTIINKKLIASSTIFQMMIDADTDNAKCLALADAEVAELEVAAGAKVTKAKVKDLKLSRDMTIAGLVRNGEGQLVTGDTQLQAGDRVVIFCLSGAIHKIERMFG
ncbi:MAG: Trk system potassium transporter TrkA [Muribaculaceae bacterium]|nr:Trk system potassium transporter TrkA [Muribaculaceae bacterium]MBQ3909903.1 Trk system potassium transporter TrkA [Muribaculaceae bacterium]MBQ6648519.1 Trk system potassium transporter TrkA [Muribaculaceae bacterium]